MSESGFNCKTTACAFSLLWLLASLLSSSHGYVIVNSVSWSVTNEVEEEMDSSSTEDALPALLEDTVSMWKQSYPASAYKEEREMKSRPGPDVTKQMISPSRMFSYRRESSTVTESPSLAALQNRLLTNARILAHKSKWGTLATLSAQETIQGVPFGQVMLTSDGPMDNSTGVPYFYIPPKSSIITDLMKNPVVSFTFADPNGDICRCGRRKAGYAALTSSIQKLIHFSFIQSGLRVSEDVASLYRTIITEKSTLEETVTDPQDPQCAALTLIGPMAHVQPDGADFAKKVLYSRHPVMRKWSQNNNCLLMKMNIEHIYVTDCYGGVYSLPLEDYYKVNPK